MSDDTSHCVHLFSVECKAQIRRDKTVLDYVAGKSCSGVRLTSQPLNTSPIETEDILPGFIAKTGRKQIQRDGACKP